MRERGVPAYRVVAAVLLLHAGWAVWGAWKLFSLPIEAGGLFLGLIVGIPLLVVASLIAAAAGAVLFARWMPWPVPAGLLVLLAAVDAMLLDAGARTMPVLGLIAVCVALAVLAETVVSGRHRTGPPELPAYRPAHPPAYPPPGQAGYPPYPFPPGAPQGTGTPPLPHPPHARPEPPLPWQPPPPPPRDLPPGSAGPGPV